MDAERSLKAAHDERLDIAAGPFAHAIRIAAVVSGGIEFRDAVARNEDVAGVLIQTVTHIVSVFAGIFVVVSQDSDCPESTVREEQLRRKIGFPYFQNDFSSPLLRQFVDQPLNHLPTNSASAEFRSNGKVQDPEHRFMKLIDHEADDAVVKLGHGSDTVSLSQAAEEFLFCPCELKTLPFDRKHFIHVTTDQPSDLGAVRNLIWKYDL